MTLEKHLIDTMKEWQLKIGSLDSNIRLYYPKSSLCSYLSVDKNIKDDELCSYIEKYFAEQVKCLPDITVSTSGDRFCVMVGKVGCDYVEKNVPEPEFLVGLLNVLKGQNMSHVIAYFETYAENKGTQICMENEEEHQETIISFEDEKVEPYVYCIDDNEFGITYHRFTKEEYADLHGAEQNVSESYPDMVHESESVYKQNIEKRQGEYIVEDYLAWPEEERIELIDGVIYDMASPIDVHQIISGLIYNRFVDYIMKNKGLCVPVISPIDVQLDKDDRTMVQPDVIIVCDRDKFQNGRIFGAPDLVVEVLSPSTRKKDMHKKMFKYLEAGVREYWIVDPRDRRVIVYLNEVDGDIDISMYSFEDIVPVRIFDDQCEVDFKAIDEYISFLY